MSNSNNLRATLRSVYRLVKTPKLSKHLETKAKKLGTDIGPRNQITRHVLRRFRTTTASQETTTNKHDNIKLQNSLLQNYQLLLKDLQERGRLYELDRGADEKLTPKELSRRAAARAGLQLPIESTA